MKKTKELYESMKPLVLEYLYFYISILFHIISINKKKIVVQSFNGKAYGSNAKYIVEALIKLDPTVNVVWLCNSIPKNISHIPPHVKLIKTKRIIRIYHLMTAKIWIDDCRKKERVKKRKEQFYLQTWHSPLRLKKIEKDATEYLDSKYIRLAKNDSKNIDLMISGCEFSHNIYQNSFWYDGTIERCGTPRCDIFFQEHPEIKHRVREYFRISKQFKIILYTPTFRKNQDINNYMFDFERLIELLEKKNSDKYIMLVRLHPNVEKQAGFIKYSSKVLDATYYTDMQELLYVADILITDYSSSMFDMSIAQKPCFLYTPDLENYLLNERDLYFKIDDLPFTYSRNLEELIHNIDHYDAHFYFEKNKEFLKNIGNYETGKASQIAAKIISRNML